MLRQEHVDVEAIVIDDGSTDSTAEWLSRLRDTRVTVLRHQASQGVSTARNAGIAQASAPWLAFCDDDDLWSPSKLVSQLETIKSTASTQWACTAAVLVDEQLEIMGPQEPPEDGEVADVLLARNVIPGGASGVLAAASLVRELGGFDPSLSTLADWDLWIRLAQESPLASVREPLVAYRVHASAMAHDVSRAEADLSRIAAKYRDVRASRGVEIDEAFWLWYFAQLHLRAGRRLPGARLHARLAWRHRQHRRWLLAAVGLAWPGVQDLRDRHKGRQMPPEWREGIGTWLRSLRSLPMEA